MEESCPLARVQRRVIRRSPSTVARRIGHQRRWRIALLACPLLLAAGCYTYRPLMEEQLVPGDRVRMYLSSEASSRTSARVGHPISVVEGQLLAGAADSLVVDAGWGGVYAGTPFDGRRDTLVFRQPDFHRLGRRELSMSRTLLVGTGLSAVLTLIYRWLDGGGGGAGTPENGVPGEV